MDAEILKAEPAYRYCARCPNLPVVDSHVHIWAPHTRQRPWPNPEAAKPHSAYLGVAEYGMTKQMLVAAMDSAGVDRAILIPPSWEGYYNDLALDACESFPDRFAALGRIALEQPMSEIEFREWWQRNNLLGLRCIFHSPRYQQLLVNGDFDWFWPLAEQYCVPVSIMMPRMANAADVIRGLLGKYPQLKITLDHLNIHSAEKDHIQEQIKNFSVLAKYQNFAIKTSAVPSWSQEAYPFKDTNDYLKRIFDAFGPHRMFWGSDFTRLDVNYRSAVCHFIEELDWMDSCSLQLVMGRGITEWLGWNLDALHQTVNQ